MAKKRLFFGFSIDAPWPTTYPQGRIIEESSRHLTLAFLGNISFDQVKNHLSIFPKPEFLIGPVGLCDTLLFLPKAHPRVVANHISWLENKEKIETYHKKVLDWVKNFNDSIDQRPLLSHVTLARNPFIKEEWKKAFTPLPLMITGIHLYESIGNLHYSSLWHLPLVLAFEEFEHTADIAFYIRGMQYQELYLHAAIAMSFTFTPFLSFLLEKQMHSLTDVIQSLNQMIFHSDQEIGCPFKAVSYHGKLYEKEILEWEMIVDV